VFASYLEVRMMENSEVWLLSLKYHRSDLYSFKSYTYFAHTHKGNCQLQRKVNYHNKETDGFQEEDDVTRSVEAALGTTIIADDQQTWWATTDGQMTSPNLHSTP
jgi:hypothetical protein